MLKSCMTLTTRELIMFHFFSNVFKEVSDRYDSNPKVTSQTERPKPGVPFTTQAEVLTKYNAATHDNGDIVGMCRSMTAEYASTAIQHQNTRELLDHDLDFLSRSIRRENAQLAKPNTPDMGHQVFKEHNLPHSDMVVAPGKLESQLQLTLAKNERKNEHVIVTVQTGPGDERHEAYIGKTPSFTGNCRFFDANTFGGERRGPCDAIIKEFHESLQKLGCDSYPAVFGIS